MTELNRWNAKNKALHTVGFQAGLTRTYSKNYVKAMNPYARLGYLEGQLEAAEILTKLEV